MQVPEVSRGRSAPALGSVCLWLSFHPPLVFLILNVSWGTQEGNSGPATQSDNAWPFATLNAGF